MILISFGSSCNRILNIFNIYNCIIILRDFVTASENKLFRISDISLFSETVSSFINKSYVIMIDIFIRKIWLDNFPKCFIVHYFLMVKIAVIRFFNFPYKEDTIVSLSIVYHPIFKEFIPKLRLFYYCP